MMNNYLQRILSKMSGKKKVYFLAENPYSASTTTRGRIIGEELQRNGIYSFVFNLRYESESDYKKIKRIKNSRIIFIKRAFKDISDLLVLLKGNGNTLIWDPLDELENLKEDKDVQMFDGVIWANKKCAEDMTSYFRKDCMGKVIYHHWDPRCEINNAEGYRLLYFGDPTPENIAQEYIDHIKNINIERCTNIKDVTMNDLFRKIREYNCHFSVRKDGEGSSHYKPNVKLVIASATGSNMILSRDISNIEMLDSAYPYYTNSDLKSVQAAVSYSRETYGSETWKRGLDMMRDIRERTSVKKIGQDYIEFLNQFYTGS